MAKVILTESQRLQQLIKDTHKEIRHKLLDNNVTQKELAELTGLTQQAISYQVKTGNFTFKVLVAIQMLTDNR